MNIARVTTQDKAIKDEIVVRFYLEKIFVRKL